jgi:peptidyl-prolyl cis-trans isomerase A (cyclophilin A)
MKAPVAVVFETQAGIFEVAIDVDKAPATAANFLKYIDAGHYNDGYFHRTVRPDTQRPTEYPIQVIQASRKQGTPGFGAIPLERTSVTGLKHAAGTLSMARSAAPDSAQSDFFICVTDCFELDFGGKRNPDGQGFAAFGRVTSGMNVVGAIHRSPTDMSATSTNTERLQPLVAIVKASRKA